MKYSQYTEEDFLLDFFKNKSNGFLVDIGAADGITNSNSRRLILDGWSGILIEPNKKNYNKLLDLYQILFLLIVELMLYGHLKMPNVMHYIHQNLFDE